MEIDQKRKILPTITTTKGSDWQGKIKEIKELGLEEIAIFPTCFDRNRREELYRLIEKTGVKKISFVHMRGDMAEKEIDYLITRYGTKIFNIHSQREYPRDYDYSKYKEMICIENVYKPLDEDEIKDFKGVCLDLSHLENDRLLQEENFKRNTEVLDKLPVFCNHISAVTNHKRADENGFWRFDSHCFENLAEFDYLKKYPQKYFSSFVAIELENSIKDQLRVIGYVEKILAEK